MRVLSVHNRYRERGGEDESREAEESVLRQHGHEVVVYERSNEELLDMSPPRSAARTIWSLESARDIDAILRESRFDVVHVQNFFPMISPSVHRVARRHGVAVVQSLRNYRLMCPAGTFHRDGRICEDCLHQLVPISSIVHACYRDSRLANVATAGMLTTHRLLRTWRSSVDVFVALTEFAKAKFLESGMLPAERVVVKPNFVARDPGAGPGAGGYALFVGRLSEEKGVRTLLRAWRDEHPSLPLRIVGDGPIADEVEAAAASIPAVEWLGRLPGSETMQQMRDARVVVVPSEWYETFGRVCVEAFACGTPVVASNLGALSELVDDGRTGALFPAGSALGLASAIERVVAADTASMRVAARAEYEARYTAEAGYDALLAVYERARWRAAGRSG